MQIRKRRAFKKFEPEKKRVKMNSLIRVPEVFVIDENGNQLGKLKTKEALEKAKSVELDLVEVNPKANPPVCKIMDYGKIKYEKEKLAHKQKVANKKVETKGVRLSFKIKGGDLEIRVKQAKKFLDNGHQVKIEMILKGREKAYGENAKQIVNNFVKSFGEDVKIISAVQKQGGKISATIAPVKN